MDILSGYPSNGYIFSDSNLTQVQEFLRRGVDPNYRYYNGITLFHAAVDIPFDNVKVVREFINAGADVNLRTHLDLTPLHFAVYHRKQQVVDALIQSGASVNAKDFLGRTSLHLAVSPLVLFGSEVKIHSGKKTRIINELLKHKADINAVDLNGETALMVAVKNEKVKGAVQLLFNNANPNICNNVSETPLHAAFALSPNSAELELLLKGASIYSVDKNGQTPLDILFNGLYRWQDYYLLPVLKVIAFKYNITNDLKQKLEFIPELSQFFNNLCDEVDHMRSDFITGNITMHDFLWESFNENYFECLPRQIHKPVVERLIANIYPEYFIDIFAKIPDSSLFLILKMKACSKKHEKAKGEVKNLSNLLSNLDIIYLLSDYLSCFDIFCLIVAFSNVKIAQLMQNIHELDIVLMCLDPIGSEMYFTERS